MTENHSTPAVTLKIIDATFGFSILFCNYEFIRKNTNHITLCIPRPSRISHCSPRSPRTLFPTFPKHHLYPKPTFPT